jgi:hypothetical protein
MEPEKSKLCHLYTKSYHAALCYLNAVPEPEREKKEPREERERFGCESSSV